MKTNMMKMRAEYDRARLKAMQEKERLIDVAPELLEALESLAAFAAREMGIALEECVSGPIGQARVIIAKAKGE